MATALHSMELRQRIAADAAIIVASLRMAFDFSISFEINSAMLTEHAPIKLCRQGRANGALARGHDPCVQSSDTLFCRPCARAPMLRDAGFACSMHRTYARPMRSLIAQAGLLAPLDKKPEPP
jgi:hypothetical protein